MNQELLSLRHLKYEYMWKFPKLFWPEYKQTNIMNYMCTMLTFWSLRVHALFPSGFCWLGVLCLPPHK